MKIFRTQDNPHLSSEDEELWVYNGLDCCVTKEVFDQTFRQLDNTQQQVYSFERDCMAPALEMMLRGLRVDFARRDEMLEKFHNQLDHLKSYFYQITEVVYGEPLRYNKIPGAAKLQDLFYNQLGIKPIKAKVGKEWKVSTNREALEKCCAHFYAQPFAKTVLAIRDVQDKLSVLLSSVDPDGRMRYSLNVGATETGRWSGSKSTHGTGLNPQNITDELRIIFVADPGKKIAYPDLEQAESRNVAYLSGDAKYIEACESGDLHTSVARLIWPELRWSNDPKEWRVTAEQKFYRHFSYRDMSKRGGHATNYWAKPGTISIHLHIPRATAEEFQYRYFGAFPGIQAWQHSVAEQIQEYGYLVTALGRKRDFLARLTDDATIREAIAFEPQSLCVEICNMGMMNVWNFMRKDIDLLLQVHDALLLQYPSEREDELLPQVIKHMTVPIEIKGRMMTIPVGPASGWNWGKYNEGNNPNGQRDWKGHDARQPEARLVD